MRVVVFGASGMVGRAVLLECLDDDGIEAVTTVGRRALEIEHEKLEQVVHEDFGDFSGLADQLSGLDACLWCVGIASSGVSEADYRRITVDYTMAAAEVLLAQNPTMTFCFVSGAGTHRDSRQMWARVKAEAEDRLGELGFASLYHFRPGMIQPMRGVRSKVRSYRVGLAIMRPFFPLLRKMPSWVTTSTQVAHAMIRAARSGAPKQTLENRDICALADAEAEADAPGAT